MAYPTGLLSRVLEDVDRMLISLKAYCTSRRDQMAAGNVQAGMISDDIYVRLQSDKAALQAAAATPGIGQYAKEQKDDAGLDVVTEFQALITAITGTIDWITANFPQDGSGYLRERQFGGSGPVDRQFTPADTTALRTNLDNIINAIN